MTNTQNNPRERASNALHNILTSLNAWKWSVEKWDSETWIVFHNLLLLFSMRLTGENWAMRILKYNGGIIPILEKKKESGVELSCDPVQVLCNFITIGSHIVDTDRDSIDEGNVRICKALREMRNKLISKEDDPFAYLLTQSGLEITSPYMEADIHECYRISLSTMTESMSRHTVRNLQFEVSKNTTAGDVEKALFDYFINKGLRTHSGPEYCGGIYNDSLELVWYTSITVDKGSHNSVAVVSLTN